MEYWTRPRAEEMRNLLLTLKQVSINLAQPTVITLYVSTLFILQEKKKHHLEEKDPSRGRTLYNYIRRGGPCIKLLWRGEPYIIRLEGEDPVWLCCWEN